jgi:16S rRNA processing protein RimM
VSGERVVIGRVVRAHGVRGDVVVAPTGDDPGRFALGETVYTGPSEPDTLTVRSRHDASGFYRIGFAEIEDRDEAERLIGQVLYQEVARLPELPAGSYYHYQLVGLTVRRADGTRLGAVAHVHELPGSDLYEVHDVEAGREWMIPARRELIEALDLEAGEIRLRPCDDLLAAVESRRKEPGSGSARGRGHGKGGRRPRRASSGSPRPN